MPLDLISREGCRERFAVTQQNRQRLDNENAAAGAAVGALDNGAVLLENLCYAFTWICQ
jgi:hypothetical protein